MTKKWEDLPGSEYDQYRRFVVARRFHFIQIIDAAQYLEEENKSLKYLVELHEVDISQLEDHAIKESVESCGYDFGKEPEDKYLAEMLFSYGHSAPLWSLDGPSKQELLRNAKRVSEYLFTDQKSYDFAMSRPVNAIGTSARDYMKGDLSFGTELHGYKFQAPAKGEPFFAQVNFHKIPSDDGLAYWSGFTRGLLNDYFTIREGTLAGAALFGFSHGQLVRDHRLPVPDFYNQGGIHVEQTKDRPNG